MRCNMKRKRFFAMHKKTLEEVAWADILPNRNADIFS
jgi:hypothetical protein